MQTGLYRYGVSAMEEKFLEKPVTFLFRSKEEDRRFRESSSGRSYGDLFTYEKSRKGKGLAVTGFRGDKNKTIIFQNRTGNTPVVEIADDSFSNSPTEEAILTEGIAYIGRNALRM